MTKHEFIAQLRNQLSGLPQEDIDKSIEYYSEIIDDRIEDGSTEDMATEAIGSPSEIAKQILMDTPIQKLVKAKAKPQRALKVWEIILLILGSPLWLSLLFAGVMVIFAVYIALWSVIVSLYAVDLSLAAGGLGGLLGFVVLVSNHYFVQGIFTLGIGLIFAGFAVLFFFACNLVSKVILIWSKKILLFIKSCIIGKEKVK